MDKSQAVDATNPVSPTGNALQYMVSELLCKQIFRSAPKYEDVRCLAPYGYRVYSQNDEDGIIAEIVRRIGKGNGRFVEFGVGDGLENNTLNLLLDGWSGAWIDRDAEGVARIQDRYARLMDDGRLRVTQASIDAGNIQAILRSMDVPREFDLLSIDIDGNDYWVWKAMTDYRPRCIVIEYNAGMGPRGDWKMKYDPTFVWQGTRNFGASLKALELLGREMGYCLVGCSVKGINAFFVRHDLVGDQFQTPCTSEFHFEPPRYHLWFWTGHRKDFAEVESFGI